MKFQLHTQHFNATEQLVAYIDKKVEKLNKYSDIIAAELTLKVVKPESAKNKEANLHLALSGRKLHFEKVADTFEEAIDAVVDMARRELNESK
ncbi:MAG: HPF/RaiA family ribosome-associated protein [Bacteroidales bacterium]|nr:HPF/RaiA family ribosome-associated protein [Bacteroidales bacterium]